MLAVLVAAMVLFYSFQSLFTRLYSANYEGPDAGQSTTIFSICYGVFIGLATLIVGGFQFAPSWQTVLFGVLNALMLALYNTSMIESGNRGPYSFLMICVMFGGLMIPLITGVAFLGEVITPIQWIAIALMLAAFVVMNARGLSLKGASKGYYLWCFLLFLSNGLYAVVMNLQTTFMNGAERTEMLSILFLTSALLAAVPKLIKGQGRELIEGFKMGKKAALHLLICCASATAAANLLMYILTQMEASILYTIDNGGVLVLSVIYSLILFKERPRWEQWIGIAMALISIVMLNLPV
ncbi:MAG: DMT family transporter [Clostridia bacterium]|nr:DMT family transporter [Clostridia bacterium]